MAVTIGTRLGSYEILAPLGAGGMGEVYRARDAKLKREVAIKILSEAFSSDPDRLARFQREAEILASLNHPNIAAIHNLEEANGSQFLVLELVEGDTLAERIGHGPIPVSESLQMARQIAEALEAAHEKGFIHRDLKPANIKITPDGKVKVLDFGLGKIFQEGPFAGEASSNSPTLLGTMAGAILGTASYMSPEQARGRQADKTSDIWAFGCVLYEMLTGRQAFGGETITDILGSIVKVDPDWSVLAGDTPPLVRSLIRRCLQKDQRHRLHTIADARIEIEEVLADPGFAVPVSSARTGSAKRRDRVAWIVAAISILALVGLLPFAIAYVRRGPSETSIRFSLYPPANAAFGQNTSAPFFAVSPDGRRIAFQAVSDGVTRYWIQSLDSLEAQPLAGTEAPSNWNPFWSPDSRFFAFFAQGKLKKIDADGGPPLTLCDAAAGAGGSWNYDGTIIFSEQNGLGPLLRVSAQGGTPTILTSLDRSNGEIGHASPYFLPDGKHFLYLIRYAEQEKNAIYVGAVDSLEKKLVIQAGSNGLYAPPGYVLFLRGSIAMALPLDSTRVEVTGEAFPIAEGVRLGNNGFFGNISVSSNGVLVYRTGDLGTYRLLWLDRFGRQLDALPGAADYQGVDLSHDGRRIAVHRHETAGGDIWLIEQERGTLTRFTFNAAQNHANPLWSPDGARIVFNATRSGRVGIYQKPASGAASDEVLFESGSGKTLSSWSPDGGFIMFENLDPKTGRDLWILPTTGDHKPFVFLQTESSEQHGQFSPDGRWVAYKSTESGRSEIYVQPFPPSGGKWQVSTSGGDLPRWRRDGKEIFFVGLDRKVMVAPVRSSPLGFEAGVPQVLFQSRISIVNTANHYPYAVSNDGQRFLITSTTESSASAPLTVVVNWTATLKNP